MKRIKSRNLIDGGKIFPGYVYYENGMISAVTREELPFDEEENFGDLYVSAGMIDMHTHGAVGADFMSCTAEDAVRAANYHFRHGTTTIVPTTLASSCEKTVCALEKLQKAARHPSLLGCIAGAHIEGPYFSPQMAGAQNPAYLSDPIESDYQSVVKKFGKFIKKWSYAPERDKNGVFCRYLTKHGVVASAGHTAATFRDMKTAYGNGLRSVTHLYSCTSTITRHGGFRELGVIESAYYFDDIYVELIADGKHLPAELIQLVFRLKKKGKIVLVSDSLSIAGSNVKEGVLNGIRYTVEDGVAKLADRSGFAGSIATADVLIRTCTEAGVPLAEAVRAASEAPAKLLHLKKGRLAAGYDADFAVFDKNINIRGVISRGERKV